MREVAYGLGAGCTERGENTNPHTQKINKSCAHLHLETKQELEVAPTAKQRAPQQKVRGLEPTRIIAEAKSGAKPNNRNKSTGKFRKTRNGVVRVVDLKL